MARLSDLPRRPPAKRQSTRWLWFVLLGAGFVLGHFFNRADDDKKDQLPLAGYRLNDASLPLSARPENETSAIADAAPNDAGLAHNEPSAIASGRGSTEATTTEYKPATVKAPIASPKNEGGDRGAASNYTALRRELLRHLR